MIVRKTNWDEWKEEVKPETIGHILSIINGEWSDCEYCPKGCQRLCKEYKKEERKWLDGEPFDKEKRDIADDCETMFVHWAKRPAPFCGFHDEHNTFTAFMQEVHKVMQQIKEEQNNESKDSY